MTKKQKKMLYRIIAALALVLVLKLLPPLPTSAELLLYCICAISLTSTGSRQSGSRVCVSQMNRPEQFEMLEERLTAFAENNR